MHATLKIEKSRIAFNRPLRMTPHKRNKKSLRASSAIPAYSRLVNIKNRCHFMTGSQPDETIKRLQQLSLYHATSMNTVGQ
jgi:hypothetical protein